MTVMTYASAKRMRIVRVRHEAGTRWWLVTAHPNVARGFTFWTTDTGIVRA